MAETKEKQSTELKIDIPGLLKVIALLYAILIIVGVLTYVLPAGSYQMTESATGKPTVVPGTFEFREAEDRVPWYRWLTSPVETFLFDSDRGTMYQVIAMILILGGSFAVLEKCGAMSALVKLIIIRFRKRRFLAICGITLFMMLLASLFGVQEELLILFPVFLTFSTAMRWDKRTALALVLITTGVGFTAAMLNPFTVGVCSTLAGVRTTDGLWYRAVMFALLAVVTCFYLVGMAKKDEAAAPEPANGEAPRDMDPEEKKKAYMTLALFSFVLLVVIVFSAVPALAALGLAMIIMAVAFVIGTVVIGRMMIGGFGPWFRAFFGGILNILPSIALILIAFSIKYIAEKGGILHTMFYWMSGILGGMSPYIAVLVLLGFILVLEFFIPSSTAKAALIIPLLTLAPIPGISKNVIILCYLLGDGYTNVVYPTCGTLMIGLGLAGVSYIDWIKRTGLFQLFLLLTSVLFLWGAVALGL
ncbi:MAG: YfcC family protein [Clostridia bacterium]|nr:YfcC family protein [Clostridia bacterium]